MQAGFVILKLSAHLTWLRESAWCELSSHGPGKPQSQENWALASLDF